MYSDEIGYAIRAKVHDILKIIGETPDFPENQEIEDALQSIKAYSLDIDSDYDECDDCVSLEEQVEELTEELNDLRQKPDGSHMKGVAAQFYSIYTSSGLNDTPEIARLRTVIESALRIATGDSTGFDECVVAVIGANLI